MHEWAWDETVASQATQLSKGNREVRFHPGNSSGTAAVRGNSSFRPGNIYYWEIKMLTSLYGTDVVSLVFTYLYVYLLYPHALLPRLRLNQQFLFYFYFGFFFLLNSLTILLSNFFKSSQKSYRA